MKKDEQRILKAAMRWYRWRETVVHRYPMSPKSKTKEMYNACAALKSALAGSARKK